MLTPHLGPSSPPRPPPATPKKKARQATLQDFFRPTATAAGPRPTVPTPAALPASTPSDTTTSTSPADSGASKAATCTSLAEPQCSKVTTTTTSTERDPVQLADRSATGATPRISTGSEAGVVAREGVQGMCAGGLHIYVHGMSFMSVDKQGFCYCMYVYSSPVHVSREGWRDVRFLTSMKLGHGKPKMSMIQVRYPPGCAGGLPFSLVSRTFHEVLVEKFRKRITSVLAAMFMHIMQERYAACDADTHAYIPSMFTLSTHAKMRTHPTSTPRLKYTSPQQAPVPSWVSVFLPSQ